MSTHTLMRHTAALARAVAFAEHPGPYRASLIRRACAHGELIPVAELRWLSAWEHAQRGYGA